MIAELNNAYTVNVTERNHTMECIKHTMKELNYTMQLIEHRITERDYTMQCIKHRITERNGIIQCNISNTDSTKPQGGRQLLIWWLTFVIDHHGKYCVIKGTINSTVFTSIYFPLIRFGIRNKHTNKHEFDYCTGVDTMVEYQQE